MKRIKEIYKNLNKNEWFEPVFVMGMSLTVTLGIVVGVHSVLGEKVVTITTDKGQEMLYEGNFDEAINEYTKLQKSNEWPIWQVKLAEVYSLKGDFQKSNALLKEAVLVRHKINEKNPGKYENEDRELINEVVFCYFMNKEFDQALSLGEDYIASGVEYNPLIRTMFSVYMAAGEMENAKDILSIYKVNENSAIDISTYGYMQMLSGDIREGLETLNLAFNLDNNQLKTLEVVANIAKYNRDELLIELEDLLKENTNEPSYKLFLTELKINSTKEDIIQAQDLINDLSIELGESISFKTINAYYLNHVGRIDEAEDIIKDLAKEKTYLGYYLAAKLNFAEEKYDRAEEYCKQSILENKDYMNNYMLMAEILHAKGQVVNLDGYYRTAMSKEPFNIDILMELGDYYTYTNSQYKKGIEYYNLALQMQPNSDELYYSLANVEIAEENFEQAEAYLMKAIELNETNGNYHRTLGNVYLKLGENEKSIEYTRNAYTLNEEDVLALNNIGCYYMAMEGNIWRGFGNIEAAFEEMPTDFDSEKRNYIVDNYNKAKELFDKVVEDENAELSIPEFEFFY